MPDQLAAADRRFDTLHRLQAEAQRRGDRAAELIIRKRIADAFRVVAHLISF